MLASASVPPVGSREAHAEGAGPDAAQGVQPDTDSHTAPLVPLRTVAQTIYQRIAPSARGGLVPLPADMGPGGGPRATGGPAAVTCVFAPARCRPKSQTGEGGAAVTTP